MANEALRRQPERQCIACGRRGPQASFLRFHLVDEGGSFRVVAQGPSPRSGRGAYVCPRRSCLDSAMKKRSFQRAFSRPVVLDQEELLSALSRRTQE